MSHFISQESEKALFALFPQAQGRVDAPTWLVDQLVEAELHRRGVPDKVSGAFHALSLTQGTLLKDEFDFSTQAHGDGWTVGAVLVDPLEFMLFNQRFGFSEGDRALAALVKAMYALSPSAKVVRIHTDGFAMLFGPAAQERVSEAMLGGCHEVLSSALISALPPDIRPQQPWRLTLGCMELTVEEPPHWNVLGPLVWAECERALRIARVGSRRALQLRRVAMNGRLPDFSTSF